MKEKERAHREKRVALETATAAHLVEGAKMGKKLVIVRELSGTVDGLRADVSAKKAAEEEARAVLAEQAAVVAARRVEAEAAAAHTKVLMDGLEEVQLEVQQAHVYAERMADAATIAMRDADRERLRGRRAKEQVELERVRTAEARRRIAPLLDPVSAAREDFEALEEQASQLESLALGIRQRLMDASTDEYALSSRFERLLRLQPTLILRREEGYMHMQGLTRDYDQLVDGIKMQQYQDAFFKRHHRKSILSVEGQVFESVGRKKTHAWEDVWHEEKGVGPWVVKLALAEQIYELEKRAVVECDDTLTQVKAEYDAQHEVVIHLRTENEDQLTEARVEREQADRAKRALDDAITVLEGTQTEVAAIESKYEQLVKFMDDTLESAEDLTRASERANSDRSVSRISADMLQLKAEDMEHDTPPAKEAEAEQTRLLAIEEEQLPACEALIHVAYAAHQEAAARVDHAVKTIEVKEAEAAFQAARQAREEAKRDKVSAEMRRVEKEMAGLKKEAAEERQLLTFAPTVEATQKSIKDLRAQGSALQQASIQISSRVDKLPPSEAKERELQRETMDALFRSAALRNRQSLLAEEQLASRLAHRDAVVNPAAKANQMVLFARWAAVFAPAESKATLVREAGTTRPVGMRGWVAKAETKKGGGESKCTALAARPFESGRHSWTFHVDQIAGKGMVLFGIVQDKTACVIKTVTGEVQTGSTVLVKHGTVTKFEDGTSESFSIDVDNYMIGNDARSWAIASDGIKMHGGREVDYGGCSIVSGDAVNVLLDLEAGTLAFSIRGKQLGAEMHGVTGPVVPAISVTRTRTCSVTIADYWTL